MSSFTGALLDYGLSTTVLYLQNKTKKNAAEYGGARFAWGTCGSPVFSPLRFFGEHSAADIQVREGREGIGALYRRLSTPSKEEGRKLEGVPKGVSRRKSLLFQASSREGSALSLGVPASHAVTI